MAEPRSDTHRRGRSRLLAALAVCLLGGSVTAAASASASTSAPRQAGSTQTVGYGAYRIDVPASWPVIDLTAAPSTCVRFDRNAVYLGTPSTDQDCPAHLFGAADALLIEPAQGAVLEADVPVVTAATGTAVQVPATASVTHRFAVEVPDAGVTVLASFGSDPHAATGMLDSASSTGTTAAVPVPSPKTAARAQASAAPAPPTVAVPYTGRGFDTCSAPALSAMKAWTASPYRAAGVYIGGANRGCSQLNLSASWVQGVTTMGWSLIPIYVGLQSPTVGGCSGCARIDSTQPLQQGVAAANDAMAHARALGLGPSSPVFFDMEAYDNSNQASVNTTMDFLAAWTVTLHNAGYRSGVYSSAASGITDLVRRAGTSYPEPDEVWIAHWTGVDTTSDSYVPANLWPHQRLVQYAANLTETYGGQSLSIDRDAVDAPLAASGAGAYVQRTYADVLGRTPDTGGFQYWTGYLDFGGSRGSFVGALLGSWELDQHLVSGDYLLFLNRAADAGGRNAWATLFADTGHNDRVAAGLASSPEFWERAGNTAAGFVRLLYTTVLQRTPASGELAYWTGRLTAGASGYTVALSVIDSTEAVSDGVRASYQQFVGTAPDAGGLSYWTSQLQRTGDPRPLWYGLASSQQAWQLG